MFFDCLAQFVILFYKIHRIGQSRPVRVIRFVMKDTIEERMISLQEAKAAIGKGSMEKLKPDEVRKARIGDLKSLFSIKDTTTGNTSFSKSE